MTCKDCYHYDACNAWINYVEILYSDYDYSTEDCPFYKDKSRIVELPVLIGDTVYKICPKCSDRHDGSCNNCAWCGCLDACDVGVRVYSDGSYNKHDLQIVPYKVTEKRFVGVLNRLNTMFFLTEEAAKIALQEYDEIRKTEDRKKRYKRFVAWHNSRNQKILITREEAEEALRLDKNK